MSASYYWPLSSNVSVGKGAELDPGSPLREVSRMASSTPPPPSPAAAGRRDDDASPRTIGRTRPVRHPLYELTKPGITGFVMVTAGVSAHVASGGAMGIMPMMHTVVGTGLGTGGALALNQVIEREYDARMRRTRNRPIPSGRISVRGATLFGIALLVTGIAWLAATVGWMAAAFTALSAISYLWIYTPLKRTSYLATLAGAVPGALPALIGWTAAGGGAADFGGWVLFGIFFLWQLPHVLSLAWLLQDDYRSVGFFLTPPSDPDGRKIGRHMVFHALSLVLLGVAPTLLGLTGWIYGGGSFVLNVAMLAVCLAAAREMSEPKVKRVFFWSLLYQPLILALLLIDTHPHP